MGVKPTFGNDAIASQVNTFQVRLEQAVLFLMKSLGEELVKYAKDNRTYTDQTGNLTNSIGYAIVRNKGLVYYSAQSGGSADSALQAAMKMANECSSEFSLIIVAGMNYAAYVEAKGYNVILPAELKAKKDFPAAMNKLMAKVKGKANELFGSVL